MAAQSVLVLALHYTLHGPQSHDSSMPSQRAGNIKCMTCSQDAHYHCSDACSLDIWSAFKLFVAQHTPGSVCVVIIVTCLCLAVACQQLWQHVWSCAHTCQQPMEPFAHCQAPECDDCNTRSSELLRGGTCDHVAGPAPTSTLQICGLLEHRNFVMMQHLWCLMRDAMCYWQLLGRAGSCRLILLLVCNVFPLFELLNDGLHAYATRQRTSLHMACMHQRGSE